MESDDEFLYDEATDEGISEDEFIGDDDISMEAVTNCLENHTSGDNDSSFEILSTEKIVQCMLDSIKEVNSVVQIPATITRILLNHFKWDKEKLIEKYYDDDQDKLFAEAHVVNPFKTRFIRNKSNSMRNSSDTHEDCEICFTPAPKSSMAGLECGHQFCMDCWNDYLTTKIMEEGVVQTIACAAHKCDILVDDVSVVNLVKDPKVKLKYQQLITNSFVECNKFLRWCPTVDCNHVIKVRSIEAKPITCKCESTFCFACGESWHDPIDCQLLRKWIKQCEEDSETSTWMAQNTKECPKCFTNIEKNGGCNFVVCKKCRQQFCWVCKTATVNYSSHSCMTFKAKEPTKEILERYLFYHFRYKNHLESLKFEDVLYGKVYDKMEEMQQQDMTWVEVQFLKKGVDVLRSCRQTLMYTYAFAFYLKKINQTAIFEENQKDLENSVEILSGYLERDIADSSIGEIKRKVQDMCCYCESRRKVLLAHVHEGNDKDWWQFIKN